MWRGVGLLEVLVAAKDDRDACLWQARHASHDHQYSVFPRRPFLGTQCAVGARGYGEAGRRRTEKDVHYGGVGGGVKRGGDIKVLSLGGCRQAIRSRSWTLRRRCARGLGAGARGQPPGACGARTQPPCPRAPHTLHRPRSSQRCALCACRLAPCLPRMYIPPAPRTRTAPGCPAVCLSGCLAPSGLHEHPPMCNTQVHNARDSFATNRLVGHGGGRARTREDGCGREGCRRGAGQMLAQATCPAEEASACPPVGTRRLQPCWQRHRPTFWAGGPTGSGPGGPGPRSPGPGWPPRRSLLP